VQVGILDLDICGPSIPKLMGVDGMSVVSTQYGWTPLKWVWLYWIETDVETLIESKLHFKCV